MDTRHSQIVILAGNYFHLIYSQFNAVVSGSTPTPDPRGGEVVATQG